MRDHDVQADLANQFQNLRLPPIDMPMIEARARRIRRRRNLVARTPVVMLVLLAAGASIMPAIQTARPGTRVSLRHPEDPAIREQNAIDAGASDRLSEPVTSPSSGTPAEGEYARETAVTSLPLEESVALQVVAVNPTSGGIAVADLALETLTLYAQNDGGVPPSSLEGAAVTPIGETILWADGTARLFAGGLDSVGVELGAAPPRLVDGIAPALQIIPVPGSEHAWVVQPGIGYGPDQQTTLVELVDLSARSAVRRLEVEPASIAVAATNGGLVLNTSQLTETADGLIDERGTQRVVVVGSNGATRDVGAGVAFAAAEGNIARLVCTSASPECAAGNNELLVTDIHGNDERPVLPPRPGAWIPVGRPPTPTQSASIQTLSPDGSRLLIGHRQEGRDASTRLIVVDLDEGTHKTLGQFDDMPPSPAWPLATWSRDGRWIVLLFEREIRLIDAANPDNTATLTDALPAGYYPWAAA